MEGNYKMSEADLTGVLSADREERNRATARIEALCADKPDEATAFLAASLRGSPQVREVASLLLYTKLLCNAKNMAAIRPETLAQLVNAVTELVGDAQGAIPSLLLKRLAEIMMQISLKTSSPKDGLARIFQLDAAVANVNLFQLYALQVFCEFNIAQEEGGLESACGTLVAFLERNLKSESLALRVEAASALALLLNHLREESAFALFAPLLAKLTELLIVTVKEQSEQTGLKVLETFEALLETHPKSLEAESEGLLFIFTELVETKEIPDSLRVAASQLLVLIAQKNTARVKKVFVNCVIYLTGNFLELRSRFTTRTSSLSFDHFWQFETCQIKQGSHPVLMNLHQIFEFIFKSSPLISTPNSVRIFL